MPKKLTRRKFIKLASLATGTVAATSWLAACGNDTTPTSSATTIAPTTTNTTTIAANANTATSISAATTTSAAATAVATTTSAATTTNAAATLLKFPANFLWGSATSAYQVEGATKEDGRGDSIWDVFCRVPGNIKNNDTGDVADDYYHRWEQDFNYMQSLGLQAYRFSIAWPRIFPNGTGQVNQKGLDFYKRQVDTLLKLNIRPMVTLYHWDLPQALQDKGGWLNRDTTKYFADYAATVFKELGDNVTGWITHNEPWVVAYVGHAFGTHAPGMHDWAKAVQVTHNLMLSHGLAVQAYRAQNLKSQIGITLNLTQAYPTSDSQEDQQAAYRIDGFQNRWFLDPIFKGNYPSDMQDYMQKNFGPMNYVQSGDLKTINSPIDFLGVNYYSPSYVANDPNSSYFQTDGKSGGNPVTAMGWEIVPNSLYDLLMRLKKDYPSVPLYITENGAAFADTVDANNQVNDNDRLKFVYQYLAAAQKAVAAGVNLKGYFVWSLMDNFEWAEGYTKRFGITYVDYQTQKRIPKRSANWYSGVIKQNGLGPLPSDV